MGKGSILEGKSLEIGGLIQQDTEGDIEHIRKNETNKPDDGVDYERIVKKGMDYKKYIIDLKKRRETNSEK